LYVHPLGIIDPEVKEVGRFGPGTVVAFRRDVIYVCEGLCPKTKAPAIFGHFPKSKFPDPDHLLYFLCFTDYWSGKLKNRYDNNDFSAFVVADTAHLESMQLSEDNDDGVYHMGKYTFWMNKPCTASRFVDVMRLVWLWDVIPPKSFIVKNSDGVVVRREPVQWGVGEWDDVCRLVVHHVQQLGPWTGSITCLDLPHLPSFVAKLVADANLDLGFSDGEGEDEMEYDSDRGQSDYEHDDFDYEAAGMREQFVHRLWLEDDERRREEEDENRFEQARLFPDENVEEDNEDEEEVPPEEEEDGAV